MTDKSDAIKDVDTNGPHGSDGIRGDSSERGLRMPRISVSKGTKNTRFAFANVLVVMATVSLVIAVIALVGGTEPPASGGSDGVDPSHRPSQSQTNDDDKEKGSGDGEGKDADRKESRSSLRKRGLIERVLDGEVDVRLVVSGDLERGGPYEEADDPKLLYVAYPKGEDGDYDIDTIRVADGTYSFDMPAGFWLSEGESDNPAVKTFIRNDELGVTIGIGRGKSDKTATQIREEWDESLPELAHTGVRYSRVSKRGLASGLVWNFMFDETSGMRHLVSDAPDGTMIYVDVVTEPWPDYERKGHPHVARWIHEFVNSIQLLDGEFGSDGS